MNNKLESDLDKTTNEAKINGTILEYYRKQGKSICQSPCGGKGTCGKCLVKVTSPYSKTVLACQTPMVDGMTVELIESPDDSIVVLQGNISANENKISPQDDRARIKNSSNIIGDETRNSSNITGNETKELSSMSGEETSSSSKLLHDEGSSPRASSAHIVAACDIGTTTVVCYLIDTKTGKIISSRSGANLQRSFGADVISRIEATTNNKSNLDIMNKQISTTLEKWLEEMLLECGLSMLSYMTIAANTTMCHLLCGISPEKIGKAPFMPEEFFGKEFYGSQIKIPSVEKTYIFPAVSGFVGGDITAGMAKEVDEQQLTLYLDIGTNGEMSLGKGDKYLCCATAAGPAFEGAQIEMGMPAAPGAIDKVWLENGRIRYSVIGEKQPVGICGSGLIDALAVMSEAKIIDSNCTIKDRLDVPIQYRGHIVCDDYDEYYGDEYENSYGNSVEKGSAYAYSDSNEEDSSNYENVVFITPNVYITQDDIRKLQLAKAAVAAGIEVLIKEYGCSVAQIDVLKIAGGFGSFINKKSAAEIGLFPAELLDKAVSVGNAAGNGAIEGVISQEFIEKTTVVKNKMKYIELSMYDGFDDIYVNHMNL